jgi:hypothetical protein
MVKDLLEDLLVSVAQEHLERLIHDFVSQEVEEEVAVEHDVVQQMPRELAVLRLHEIYHLLDALLVTQVCEDVLYQAVEQILPPHLSLLRLQLRTGQEDHVVAGEPVTLHPHCLTSLKHHLSVVYCEHSA